MQEVVGTSSARHGSSEASPTENKFGTARKSVPVAHSGNEPDDGSQPGEPGRRTVGLAFRPEFGTNSSPRAKTPGDGRQAFFVSSSCEETTCDEQQSELCPEWAQEIQVLTTRANDAAAPHPRGLLRRLGHQDGQGFAVLSPRLVLDRGEIGSDACIRFLRLVLSHSHSCWRAD